MMAQAFIQSIKNQPTTLTELCRVHEWAATDDFFGLYAYATQSGAVAFDLALGRAFWNDVSSRWLFGIDYGRTQPQALKFMIGKPNVEVRIHDGAWLVDRDGFLPRQDFHMKSSFLTNVGRARFGMVLGSGNFSSNGLRHAAECGASFLASTEVEYRNTFESALMSAETLWEKATPAQDIIEKYEERWKASDVIALRNLRGRAPKYDRVRFFWIEAGYVTRNRGADKPGNQIDMPRGMNRYFGFNAPDDLPVNSVIGKVTFESTVGGLAANNLSVCSKKR
jgi:HKD family nuclease